MESQHYFQIFYANVLVLSVVAYSKYEAIDKTYQKFIGDMPNLDRKKFRAKKVY
jgi:hypothetical protein